MEYSQTTSIYITALLSISHPLIAQTVTGNPTMVADTGTGTTQPPTSGGIPGFSGLVTSLLPLLSILGQNGNGNGLSSALAAPMEDFNVSQPCRGDFKLFLDGVTQQKAWALQMLDAYGKPGPALLNARLKWLGSYDECVRLKQLPHEEGAGRPASDGYSRYMCTEHLLFQGHGCRHTVGLLGNAANNTPFAECKVDRTYATDAIGVTCFLSVLAGFMLLGTLYDVIGVQLHMTSPGDIGKDRPTKEQFISAYHSKNGVINGGYLQNEIVSETGEHIDETVFTANGTEHPIILPTEADTKQTDTTESKPHERGILEQILLSFSVYTNGVKLLSTHQGAGSLGAVNGIRFLSMAWIILGHTYYFSIGYDDNLIQHYAEKVYDWTFMAIQHASVSVDTFFTLSGLLVAYLTLREMEKVGGARGMNWFMYYFHRYWRLTPAYMLVIMVGTVIVPYFSAGPQWPNSGDIAFMAHCRTNWWTNLLYVSNLVKTDKTCLGWSWYLANDMQFYVLSPLILLPLYYHVAAGAIACLAFLGASVAATAVLVDRGQYSPQTYLPQAYKALDSNYQQNVYIPCYTRMGPYVIGMFTGYLLYKWKCTCTMPKAVVLAGWTACLGITTSIIYGLYSDGDSHVLDPPEGTAFMVLFRPGWAVAVSWVIFACATGHGGWIDELLSWKPFIPLGRMSYLAYLIHPLVMVVFYGSRRQPTHFTDYEVTYLFIGHLVMSYGVGFVLSLAFEAPMMGLEKAILKRGRKS